MFLHTILHTDLQWIVPQSVAYYMLWILLLCALLLFSMTHYDITLVMTLLDMPIVTSQWLNDIAMDINCDVTMINDIVMYTSQCIMMLL